MEKVQEKRTGGNNESTVEGFVSGDIRIEERRISRLPAVARNDREGDGFLRSLSSVEMTNRGERISRLPAVARNDRVGAILNS